MYSTIKSEESEALWYYYGYAAYMHEYIVPILSMRVFQHEGSIYTRTCLSHPESVIEAVPKSYYKLVKDSKDIINGLVMLSSSVISIRSFVTKELSEFSEFTFLWMNDKEKVTAVLILAKYSTLCFQGGHRKFILLLSSSVCVVFSGGSNDPCQWLFSVGPTNWLECYTHAYAEGPRFKFLSRHG